MGETGECGKTHSIHVPLSAALHVLGNGVSLFLGDLQPLPQLGDTATVGHARRLNLGSPILQLNPKRDSYKQSSAPAFTKITHDALKRQSRLNLISVLFSCINQT